MNNLSPFLFSSSFIGFTFKPTDRQSTVSDIALRLFFHILHVQLTLKKKDGVVFKRLCFKCKLEFYRHTSDSRVVETLMPFCPFFPAYA
ncbi:hypothetical protein T01_9026 [Trichinella spiralis]|uniref:Uncharacterized protein n=1 Tax=Trichinella spiralis TaxID=6334 RepID=A0A0V1B4Y7_TRISP|nr:hypothetical protein T01_9026 [Trichinella spiralis]